MLNCFVQEVSRWEGVIANAVEENGRVVEHSRTMQRTAQDQGPVDAETCLPADLVALTAAACCYSHFFAI
jgi:hypothetical protein